VQRTFRKYVSLFGVQYPALLAKILINSKCLPCVVYGAKPWYVPVML
jgi:hypothetical protein